MADWGKASDTWAALGLLGPLAATNPFMPIDPVSSMLGCATGAAYLGGKGLFRKLRGKRVIESEVKIDTRRTNAPQPGSLEDGLIFGFNVEDGTPLWLPNEQLNYHFFIRGATGMGKTVLAESLMYQQIQRGGGLLFTDGKIDGDNLQKLWEMAVAAGREHDLLVISPGTPGMSHSYNPVLYGDPDEVADRIMAQIPSTESSAGADHYKQSGAYGLVNLISALQTAGLAYNMVDLSIMLRSPKALQMLEKSVPSGTEADIQLKIFLDQYKTKRNGSTTIDIERLQNIFGGLAGRLHRFGTGKFGQVLNSYHPEVKLFDAIMENKIIYVALPTMGKDQAANNFGKLFIGDLRSAISWIQLLPKAQRPNPPFLAFFDEAGSYVSDTWSRMYEQARSAGIMLMPAIQTNANFQSVSEELMEMIDGNTHTKVIFRIGAHKTAVEVADYIGETIRKLRTATVSKNRGNTALNVTLLPNIASSASQGVSYGVRESKEYIIDPRDLKTLPRGEAIITYNDCIHHVRTPMLIFSDAFRDQAGPVRILHPSSPPSINAKHNSVNYKRGVDLSKNIGRYLMDAT